MFFPLKVVNVIRACRVNAEHIEPVETIPRFIYERGEIYERMEMNGKIVNIHDFSYVQHRQDIVHSVPYMLSNPIDPILSGFRIEWGSSREFF